MRATGPGLRPLLALALAALPLAAASSASAQPAGLDAIATATTGGAPLPPAANVAPLALDDRPDPAEYGAPPVNDRKIHGMVQVGAGTGGYREGAAAINGPIGQDGYFGIAVDGSQYQGRQRRLPSGDAPVPAPPPAPQ
jgi:hypothetical protein